LRGPPGGGVAVGTAVAVTETSERRRARPGRPSLVWITRAEPGASATAGRVRALGIEPIVSPLLEVRPLPSVEIDLEGVSAIAFTSANAVGAFAELCPERGLRVFAVGDATALAARERGFESVLSARGDVGALASALAARRRELPGYVLYPAAAEPAQDLAGALEAVGLKTRQVALYETTPIAPSAELVARLAEVDGVLVHSARAARALAAFLKASPAPDLAAYCLSRQIARSLTRAGLAARVSAAAPNEAALIGLLAAGP
jgi:uroporphyrinogen-III synthase